MRVRLAEVLRRRPWAGIAGSLLLHLLVLAALLWVKAPADTIAVKRGEPLFVELPKADEQAARGAPGGPERETAKPTPPAARPAPAPPPKAAPRPATPPARVVAKAPAPPAAPLPKEERGAEPAKPAPVKPEVPAEKPAVAQPKPAAPRPKEAAPHETAAAPPGPRVASVPPGSAAPDIRRGRGGSGGAGGLGEGWAGIEGEPIPLDSKNPRYNDYLDRVRRMIKEKWGYPCVRSAASGQCEYKAAKLVIVFGILKDGSVPRVDVAERSEYDIYDDWAVTAIKLASPFPPVPPEVMAAAGQGSTGIRIVASFHYILQSSLTNILR